MSKGTKSTRSSGNVFADLGLPDAKEYGVKAALVVKIATSIAQQDLNQTEAAGRLEISQPDVSRMLRGQLEAFSIERLMTLLVKLGQNVIISTAPASRKTGIIKVDA